jgi:hypothetical protein
MALFLLRLVIAARGGVEAKYEQGRQAIVKNY